MNSFTLAFTAVLFTTVVPSLGAQQSSPPRASAPAIDRRSYDLGIIAAFSELVGGGVKKLALSDVFTPGAADSVIDEAHLIAARNRAEVFRETDLIVTDLFPADVAEGKHVLLIYTGSTLDEYQALKREKAQLVEQGRYSRAAHLAIARRFGRLLSYPDWKIDELLKEVRSQGGE